MRTVPEQIIQIDSFSRTFHANSLGFHALLTGFSRTLAILVFAMIVDAPISHHAYDVLPKLKVQAGTLPKFKLNLHTEDQGFVMLQCLARCYRGLFQRIQYLRLEACTNGGQCVLARAARPSYFDSCLWVHHSSCCNEGRFGRGVIWPTVRHCDMANVLSFSHSIAPANDIDPKQPPLLLLQNVS